jgi:hypothetical protein
MAANKSEGLRIDTLEKQVRELRQLVTKTKQGNYIVVLVRSLGNEPIQLKSDISVVVQPSGDDFIATYFDAGISISGDSQEEAVDNLKVLIVDLFESYEEDEAKLGPGPRQQLAALREVIERRP